MAYSFRPYGETIEAGLRRIAVSQIEAGLVELRDVTLPQPVQVRQVRKRCKKLRALLRLVRPAFEEYDTENATFRDAAKSLSSIRDAAASLELFDRIAAQEAGAIDTDVLAPLRDALQAEFCRIDENEAEERLADLRLVFREASERAESWSLHAEGAEAFAPGAAATYRKARKAMKKARKAGEAEAFHDWRKPVKDHWYHIRLMKKLWPPVMATYIEETDRLGQILGEHHDLFILADTARSRLGKSAPATKLLTGLATSRQDELERTSLASGEKLFAAKPSEIEARWASWWLATV